MSDSLLASQCRVGSLAAQRRPVVLLFHWDSDGARNAERLPVVLLRYNTFAREERDKKGVRWLGCKHSTSQSPPPIATVKKRWLSSDRRKVDLWGEDGDGQIWGISVEWWMSCVQCASPVKGRMAWWNGGGRKKRKWRRRRWTEKSFAFLSYGNCARKLFCLQIESRQNYLWVCVYE